ncbi:MAG: hypothetical protein DIU63_11385 [Proteobacteria bacterium]|jgi:hypothetical protein|nr:MAG: hypothetical protein DIU63_11385 [Pseudomonadota bacterium]
MLAGARALLLLGMALTAGFVGADPADAKIVCRGAFQIVNGQPIATPYCEDSNLAQVAREYGIAVTARQVRQSPSVKARVCRLIGHDNRVQSACIQYRPDTPRRWF